MARINNLTNFLTDVAVAIKEKTGDSTAIPAEEFDTKIAEIQTQGSYQTKSTTISTNGNYSLTPDQGYDAMNQVDISVNVPQTTANLQTKTITTNGEHQPDTGYDGFSSVNVAVPSQEVNNQDTTITQNGVYVPGTGYTGFGEVTVNVAGGGEVPVKLFQTVAQMNADITAQEDDLALVYSLGNENLVLSTTPLTLVTDNNITLAYDYTTTSSVGDVVRIVLSNTLIRSFYMSVNGTTVLRYNATLNNKANMNRSSYDSNIIGMKIVVTDDMFANIESICTYLNCSAPTQSNFTGLYRYDGSNWVYASTQLSILNSSLLPENVLAYGYNGLITGDGTIWDNVPMDKKLKIIHNTNRIDSGTHVSPLGPILDTYAKLRDTAGAVSISNISTPSITYLKYSNFGEVVMDHCGDVDSSAFGCISDDGKYICSLPSTISSWSTTNNYINVYVQNLGQSVHITGNHFLHSTNASDHVMVVDKYMLIFTRGESDSLTGYINKLDMETGDCETLSYSLRNSMAYDGPHVILDLAHDRIYWTVCEISNSIYHQYVFYTSFSELDTCVELYHYTDSYKGTLELAVNSEYLFIDRGFDKDTKHNILYIVRLSDLTNVKSVDYNWSGKSYCFCDSSIYCYTRNQNPYVVYNGTMAYTTYDSSYRRSLNVQTGVLDVITILTDDKYYKPIGISYNLDMTFGGLFTNGDTTNVPCLPVSNNWSDYVEGVETEIIYGHYNGEIWVYAIKTPSGYAGRYVTTHLTTTNYKVTTSDTSDYDIIAVPVYLRTTTDDITTAVKYILYTSNIIPAKEDVSL